MKKGIEKLQLHRETLRSLTEDSLREVQGGASFNRSCVFSCPATCLVAAPPAPSPKR